MQIFGRNKYGCGRHEPSGLGLFFTTWVLVFLLWISSIGGIVYVAVHFIKKYW